MKYFEIFKHPSGDIKAILPEGWNWMAFLFGPVWALCHAMWAIGLLVVFGNLALAVVLTEALPQGAEAVMNIVMISTALAFGGYGNAWRAGNLRTRDYAFVESAGATSAEAALAKFLPPAPPRQQDDGNPPG